MTLQQRVYTNQWRIQDFPEVGEPTHKGKGGRLQQTILPKPQKLHEIERIWMPRGWVSKFYYVDPPLLLQVFIFYCLLFAARERFAALVCGRGETEV